MVKTSLKQEFMFRGLAVPYGEPLRSFLAMSKAANPTPPPALCMRLTRLRGAIPSLRATRSSQIVHRDSCGLFKRQRLRLIKHLRSLYCHEPLTAPPNRVKRYDWLAQLD